jgi:hypothetical protein
MENQSMKKAIVIAFLIAGSFLVSPAFAADPAPSDQGMTKEQVQIALDKIKSDKKFITSQNLPLTEAESKAFWPVYEEYQTGLRAFNQRTLDLLGEYADLYRNNTMTDEKAAKLIDKHLALETDELAMKKAFVPKLMKVLPATKAARYMQIENKMHTIVMAKLASVVPLVK